MGCGWNHKNEKENSQMVSATHFWETGLIFLNLIRNWERGVAIYATTFLGKILKLNEAGRRAWELWIVTESKRIKE